LNRRWRGSCRWRRVPSLVFADVSKDLSAFIFRGVVHVKNWHIIILI